MRAMGGPLPTDYKDQNRHNVGLFFSVGVLCLVMPVSGVISFFALLVLCEVLVPCPGDMFSAAPEWSVGARCPLVCYMFFSHSIFYINYLDFIDLFIFDVPLFFLRFPIYRLFCCSSTYFYILRLIIFFVPFFFFF